MLLGPGEIPVLVSHHAGQSELDVSSAGRAGATHQERLAATGKAGQAPTDSQSHPWMATSLRPAHLGPASPQQTRFHNRTGDPERPGSGKWSRDDRVLLDDERHEPHAKEEPDVSAPPTRPHRNRHANTPMSDLKRECAQRPPKHPRTCNKLPSVHRYTEEVM